MLSYSRPHPPHPNPRPGPCTHEKRIGQHVQPSEKSTRSHLYFSNTVCVWLPTPHVAHLHTPDTRHHEPLVLWRANSKLGCWGMDSASKPRKKAKQRTNFETLGNEFRTLILTHFRPDRSPAQPNHCPPMRSAIVLLGALALVVTLPHAAQAAHLKASVAKEHASRALNPSYQMAELGGSCGIIPSGQNYVYLTYVCHPSFHTPTPFSCFICIDKLVICNRVRAWVGVWGLCRVCWDRLHLLIQGRTWNLWPPVPSLCWPTCTPSLAACRSLLCRCQNPQCCSSAGYCGVGDAWCGKGCQPRKLTTIARRRPHNCTFIRPRQAHV